MLSDTTMHSSGTWQQVTLAYLPTLPMLVTHDVTRYKMFQMQFAVWACLCCRYVADPSMHSMPAITPNPAGTAIICQSLDNQVGPTNVGCLLHRMQMRWKFKLKQQDTPGVSGCSS